MRSRAALVLIFAAPLFPGAALADFRLPECGALAEWARGVDFKTQRKLNPYTTYAWLEDFLGAEMVSLYGKPASEFTIAEAAEARDDAEACGKTLDKADRKLLGAVEKQFAKVVGPLAANRDKALADLAPALDAFAATPPGGDKLRMIAALRAFAAGDGRGVSTAASGISREGDKVLDGLLAPMRLLPLDLATAAVLPAALEAEPASLDAVMEELRAEYAALEASERTLQRWDGAVEKIERPVARLMPPEAAPRLGELAAARRAEIEDELAGAQIARLEAMGAGPGTIAEIERVAAGNLLRQLSPDAAERFRQSLAARRQAIALALVAEVPNDPASLARLRDLEQALAQSALASDADRAGIGEAVAARRAEVAAEVARELLAAVAAVRFETEAFEELDRLSDPRLLSHLAPADADAVRAAADARRAEIGERISRQIREDLAGLAENEQALAVIDTTVLPGATALPPSARPWRDELLAAAVARRNEILAQITYEQRGALEGRVYATRDRALKVEFRDDDEAYVTEPSGQTVVAAYEEVGDEEVKLALPQATLVLKREGRWLVGGPLQLQRTDDAK